MRTAEELAGHGDDVVLGGSDLGPGFRERRNETFEAAAQRRRNLDRLDDAAMLRPGRLEMDASDVPTDEAHANTIRIAVVTLRTIRCRIGLGMRQGTMEIIPVVDLMGGVVVRARMGQRDLYQPITTPLAATSDPVDVVRGLLAVYPFTTLYVADLDAIEHNGDNNAALARSSCNFRRLLRPGVGWPVSLPDALPAGHARWPDGGIELAWRLRGGDCSLAHYRFVDRSRGTSDTPGSVV